MKGVISKIMRIVAIVLMGLTVALTLLGGVGTTCVAFGAEKYPSMTPLVPVKWLYQILVIVSIAAGMAGIRAIIGLIKGTRWSYRETLIVLAVGGAAALIQVVTSRILRGKSTPTDMRLYVTILTLLVFLLFRIPKIWQSVDFTRSKGNTPGIAGGVAAMVLGILTLTVHIWAAPTHTFVGFNYADVWHIPLTVTGWALTLTGFGLLAGSVLITPLTNQNQIETFEGAL